MRIPTYISRAHAPVNTTVEYWARPADWPGVVWHEFPPTEKAPMDGAGGYGAWFHAQGGICSGRQVDYGYWCSASAPRSGGGKLQPPYNPPGGFLYASNDSLPQAGGYRNASGAVFHARGGTSRGRVAITCPSPLNVLKDTYSRTIIAVTENVQMNIST